MEILSSLVAGFAAAASPANLLACLIGVAVGFVIGVLPGLGAPGTIAMILPLMAGTEPATALILMAGVYYGALFGGAVSAILVNTPGVPTSVVTTLDGYPLARQGKAGKALCMACLASLFGGTFSVIGLTLIAPPLATFALRFGPPEIFSLMVLGLATLGWLGEDSMLKTLLMACLGLLISTIGVDVVSGSVRFTFGLPELLDGVPFVVAAVGLFAVGEVLYNAYRPSQGPVISHAPRLREMLLSGREMLSCLPTLLRSSALGFLVGTLPGAGATIAAFMAYAMEKRLARDPQRFGRGALQGVAASESSDNASTGGALVPLFTLGLPGSASTAILLGGLLMFGLEPGPGLMKEHSGFVWTVIASMYIGNLMLAAVNLPLIPLLVRLLRVRYTWLYPFILVLCLVGTYSVRNEPFDLVLLCIFGVAGFLLRVGQFPIAPLVLTLVLGPLMERALRRSLILAMGNPLTFFSRPISLVLLILAVLFVVMGSLHRRRQQDRQQEADTRVSPVSG